MSDGESEVQGRTYEQLLVQAKRVACVLSDHWGLKPGNRVALVYPPGPAFVVAFLGCVGIGVVAVPLEPPRDTGDGNDGGEERLAREVTLAGCSVALTESSLRVTIARMTSRCRALDALTWHCTDKLKDGPSRSGRQIPCPELSSFPDDSSLDGDVAYLEVFGNAFDGSLAFVEISHSVLLKRVKRWTSCFQGKDTVMVCWFAQHASAGLLGGILGPLWVGGTAYLIPRDEFLKSPLVWFKTLSNVRASATLGLNRGYDLVRHHWRSLDPAHKPVICLSSVEMFGCKKEDGIEDMKLRMFETFVQYGLSWEKFKACPGLTDSHLLSDTDSVSLDDHQRRLPPVRTPRNAVQMSSPQWPNNDKCRENSDESCGTWLVKKNSGPVPRVPPSGGFCFAPGGHCSVARASTRAANCNSVAQKAVLGQSGQGGGGPSGKAQVVQGRGQLEMCSIGEFDASNMFYEGRGAGECKAGKNDDAAEGSGASHCGSDSVSFDNWKRSPLSQPSGSASLEDFGQCEPETRGAGQGTVYDRLRRRLSFVWDSAEYPNEENTGISPREVEDACEHFDKLRRVSEGHEPSELSKISSWNSVLEERSWQSSCTEFECVRKQASGMLVQTGVLDMKQWLLGLFRRHGVQESSLGACASSIPRAVLKTILEDIHRYCGVALSTAEVQLTPISALIRRVVDTSPATFAHVQSTKPAVIDARKPAEEEDGLETSAVQHSGESPSDRESLVNSELSLYVAGAMTPGAHKLAKPHLFGVPEGTPLTCVGRTAVQIIGLVGVFVLLSVALLPSIALVLTVADGHELSRPMSPFWSASHGLGMSVLLLAIVFLFHITLTALVVITKWGLVWRYREETVAMWSWRFTRWWFLERLLSVWELLVGDLILGTSLYNLFCYLMGARCPIFLAEISSPLREFDLIHIGQHVRIRGSVYCRSLLPGKLYLAPVVLEAGAKLDSLAVMLPGCTLAQCSVLESLGVLLEGSSTAPGTVYSGNPATAVAKTQRQECRTATSVKHARWFSVGKAATLVVNFILAVIIGAFFFSALEGIGGFPNSFKYSPILYILAVFFGSGFVGLVVAIGLKWLLLGKVRPDVVVETYWRQWRVWCVDSFVRVPMWILSPWLQRTPVFNLWFRALGMKVPIVFCSLPPDVVTPSQADLVSFETGMFGSGFVIHTKGEPPKEIAMLSGSNPGSWIAIGRSHFGAGTGVGLSCVCGPEVMCGSGTLVGSVTRLGPGTDYPRSAVIVGNPAHTMDMASDFTGNSPEVSDTGGDDDSMAVGHGKNSGWQLVAIGLGGLITRVVLLGLFITMVTIPAYESFVAVHSAAVFSGSIARRISGTWAAFALMLAVFLSGLVLAFLLLNSVYRLVAQWRLPASGVFALRSLMGYFFNEHNVFSDIVKRFVVNPVLGGTFVLRGLYRLMGARIGSSVFLTDVAFSSVHNLEIGDETVLDNSEVMGHKCLGCDLQVGPVTIGARCALQPGCVLLSGDRVEDDAVVGPRTKSKPDQVLRSHLHWHGGQAAGFCVDHRRPVVVDV